MGKAEQRCGQASSVAILRQKNLSRTICRGEQCSPLHIHRADTARLSNNTSPKNRIYTQIQKILIKKPLQLKIIVI